LLSDQAQPPVENETGAKASERGRQDALPDLHPFGHLDRITRMPQHQVAHQLDRIIKEQVHQPADHTDTSRQNQVECLLAETNLLANAQRPLPMLPKKGVGPRRKLLQFL